MVGPRSAWYVFCFLETVNTANIAFGNSVTHFPCELVEWINIVAKRALEHGRRLRDDAQFDRRSPTLIEQFPGHQSQWSHWRCCAPA
ncbi:hypothetical protein BX661DRAFT_1689 [Kickxella alabastrina]|uniref:uncharacterized protein n=1 Tax=Kickxella alabastrina TaxID=61397 RepID=UPI00221FF9AF|nr:uncharacterized protein BX661DRAFT_1689 [Kickxella alabastrina]KAI7834555.1 hypothetical protein BX661DRAFT_1689 [Kickxella alabastrina]